MAATATTRAATSSTAHRRPLRSGVRCVRPSARPPGARHRGSRVRSSADPRARVVGTPGPPNPGGRREGSRSPPRGRGMPRPGSRVPAGGAGTSPRGWSWTSARALPSAAYERFDFGAVARYTVAWARSMRASGKPTNSTACAAASATSSAHRVGQADVLGGGDDQAAGDEAGVLARLEHQGQPVEGGVGVRAPDALDEGADDVVVLVARRSGGPWRSSAASTWASATCGAPTPVVGQGDGDLEGGEDLAAVAADLGHEVIARHRRPPSPPPRPDRARSGSGRPRRSRGSRRNNVERERSGALTSKYGFSVVAPMRTSSPSSTPGSRASCWALLKRWTSSRKRIVPLVPLPEALPGLGQHLPDVLHARRHRGEGFEGRRGRARDQPGQGGLARAGRPPEDDRAESIGLDEGAQRHPRAEQVLLADHVVEAAGPHPGRQRRPPRQAFVGRGGEEVVGHGAEARAATGCRRVGDAAQRSAAAPGGSPHRRSRRSGGGAMPQRLTRKAMLANWARVMGAFCWKEPLMPVAWPSATIQRTAASIQAPTSASPWGS